MPVPKPKSGESEKEFIPRCMKACAGDGKPQDQSLAMCYSAFGEAKKSEFLKSSLRVLKAIIERITGKR